jgi:hypothetical protein
MFRILFKNSLKQVMQLICILFSLSAAAQDAIPCKKGNLWGFCIKEKSNIIIPPCFSAFHYSNFIADGKRKDLFIVQTGDKYGLVNGDGKLIIDTLYSQLEFFAFPEAKESMLYGLKKDGKVAVIDIHGNVLIASARQYISAVQIPWNDTVRNVFIENYNDSSFVYDTDYRLLVKAKDYIEAQYGGCWVNSKRIKKGKRSAVVFGLLNNSGREILPAVYSSIYPLGMYDMNGERVNNFIGILKLEKSNSSYLFSIHTNKRSPCFGRSVYPVSDSMFIAEDVKKHSFRLFNTNTNKLVKVQGNSGYSLSEFRGYQTALVIQHGNKSGVMNQDGKMIVPLMKNVYYNVDWAFDQRLNIRQWTPAGDTAYCYTDEGKLYDRHYMKDSVNPEDALFMKVSGIKYSYNRVVNKNGKVLLHATPDEQLYYFSAPFRGDTLIAYTDRGDQVKLYKLFDEAVLVDSSGGLNLLPGNFIQLFSDNGLKIKILDSNFRKVLDAQQVVQMPFGYFVYEKGKSYTYDHNFKLIHAADYGFIFKEQWMGGTVHSGFRVMDVMSGKPAGNEIYDTNFQISNNFWILKKKEKYFLSDHHLKILFCFRDSLSAFNHTYVDRICTKAFFDPFIADDKAYDLLMNNDTVAYYSSNSWSRLPGYIITVKNDRFCVYDSLGKVLYVNAFSKGKNRQLKPSLSFGGGYSLFSDSIAVMLPGAVKRFRIDTAAYLANYAYSDHKRFYFLNYKRDEKNTWNPECDMFDGETGKVAFKGISNCQNCDGYRNMPYKVFLQDGVWKLVAEGGKVILERKEKFTVSLHGTGKVMISKNDSYSWNSQDIICFLDEKGQPAIEE